MGDALGGSNRVEKSAAVVMSGNPLNISIGNLVVDPGKGASTGPCNQRASLPVQVEPAVLVFVLV